MDCWNIVSLAFAKVYIFLRSKRSKLSISVFWNSVVFHNLLHVIPAIFYPFLCFAFLRSNTFNFYENHNRTTSWQQYWLNGSFSTNFMTLNVTPHQQICWYGRNTTRRDKGEFHGCERSFISITLVQFGYQVYSLRNSAMKLCIEIGLIDKFNLINKWNENHIWIFSFIPSIFF